MAIGYKFNVPLRILATAAAAANATHRMPGSGMAPTLG